MQNGGTILFPSEFGVTLLKKDLYMLTDTRIKMRTPSLDAKMKRLRTNILLTNRSIMLCSQLITAVRSVVGFCKSDRSATKAITLNNYSYD